MDKKIVFLSDFIDQRLRKEQEIEFYELELNKILAKLEMLRKEKELTETIIDIIQNEKVIEFKPK